MRQTSRQTGHFVFTGFLANHSFKESLSNTWKQVVTAAVIGEMSSVVIEQDSLFLQASSAIIQAMRRGIGFRCVRICMGGAREGEGEREREGIGAGTGKGAAAEAEGAEAEAEGAEAEAEGAEAEGAEAEDKLHKTKLVSTAGADASTTAYSFAMKVCGKAFPDCLTRVATMFPDFK